MTDWAWFWIALVIIIVGLGALHVYRDVEVKKAALEAGKVECIVDRGLWESSEKVWTLPELCRSVVVEK